MTLIISLFIISIAIAVAQNFEVKTLYVDNDGRLYRE